MKKIVCLLLLPMFFSCVSRAVLSEALDSLEAPVVYVRSYTGEPHRPDMAEYFHLNLSENEEVNEHFQLAVEASLKQDWDLLVDILEQGVKLDPEADGQIFLAFLKKMVWEPFPVDRVCRILLEYNPDSSSLENQLYRNLLATYETRPMEILWAEGPVTEDIIEDESISNSMYGSRHPVVNVEINGVIKKMMLDTGAESSLLYKDAFNDLNSDYQPIANISLGAINGKVSDATVYCFDSIEIGALQLNNFPVIVAKRPMGSKHFDGLIGWPILCQMKIRVDYHTGEVTFYEPEIELNEDKNFFWVGEPVVSVTNYYGSADMLFSLDTGSFTTFISDKGLEYMDPLILQQRKKPISGVNGTRWIDSNQLDEVELVIGGLRFEISNLWNTVLEYHFLTIWDGLLGNDLFEDFSVIYDFPNGRIEIE